MTEAEKRFKIQKRTSYEEEISDERKEVTSKTFWLGFSVIAAICSLTASITIANDLKTHALYALLGFFQAGLSVCFLKNLIEAIGRKTMLESKVEDITNQLELLEEMNKEANLSENEESRGMR